MFFLILLLLGALVWALGLFLLRPATGKIGFYSGLSAALVVTGLTVFSALSSWAGILPLQLGGGALVQYSVSFPEGYLARGAVGMAVLLVGIFGICSPLFAAWFTNRHVIRGLA